MKNFRVILVISLILFEITSSSSTELAQRNTSGLVELTQKLQDNINAATSNPCDNYFDFVCDNTVPHKDIINYDISEKFSKLFDGVPADDSEADTQIDNFLKSCREADISQLPASVEKFSKARKYWPAFNPDWTENDLNLTAAVTELNSLGLEAFFEVELEHKSNDIFVEISAEGVGISKNIGSILNYTGLTADQIAEIIDDCTQLRNVYKQKIKNVAESPNLHVDVYQLWDEIPQLEWPFVINTILGDLNSTSRIVVKDINKLKASISVMFTAKQKWIANYLFYLYVKKGVSYLDLKRPDRHNTFCRDAPQDYFLYNVFNRVVKRHRNLEKQKLFMDVIKISADHLKNAGYAFEEYPNVEDLHADIDSELTNFLEEIDQVNDAEYSELTMSPDDFLYNRLLLKRASHQNFNKELENMQAVSANEVHTFFPRKALIASMLFNYSEFTPVAFNLVAKKFISQVVSQSAKTKAMLSQPTTGDCLKIQLNSRKKDVKWVVESLLEAEVLFNAFTEFSLKYPEVVKSEEVMFQAHELTGKKVLYMIFMQQYCDMPKYKGKTTDVVNKRRKLLAQLANYEAFPGEYNCPAGSPMNPEVKCKDQ